MGTLRQGCEGLEFPIHSDILIDDIHLIIIQKHTGWYEDLSSGEYYYGISHHIISEEEENWRNDLNPRRLYYIPADRKNFPPCPQTKWIGYKHERSTK